MAIKFFILSILIFLTTTYLCADSNYFNQLKKSTNLKKGEQLVIVYQDIGSCIKCYLEPMQKIESLAKTGKIKNYKIIALVRCKRNIELNIFKNQFNWKNYLLMDDGNSRKKLGSKEYAKVIVLNYFGKILFEF
jgi:hypothetical protein